MMINHKFVALPKRFWLSVTSWTNADIWRLQANLGEFTNFVRRNMVEFINEGREDRDIFIIQYLGVIL